MSLTPPKYEIRNKRIEDAHPVKTGECITRKMTDEEWAKYGPKSNRKRKCFLSYRRSRRIEPSSDFKKGELI